MNIFEQNLRHEIPLHEAARFFVSFKKLAEATSPPDETGTLEGMFAVPVEQALALMANQVRLEFETLYAYHVYAQTLRDLSHDAIAEHFLDHAEEEQAHADFLLKRMAVLGGPANVPDLAAPHGSTNPVDIVHTLIRMEQEGIASWRQLLTAIGENPMKVTIEDYMAQEQQHLDELWQLLPDELKGTPTPAGAGAEAQAVAPTGVATEEPAVEEPPAAEPSIEEKKASMRFKLAMMKLAVGEGDGTPMSPPTQGNAPPADTMPTNYLQAEMMGQQAQQQNEAAFYRGQLGNSKATAALMQQQVADIQGQLQQLQEQVSQSSSQVEAATQQAVQAQDMATQQTLESAKARLGAQQMRAQILEIASQDPQMMGEQALAPAQQPGMPGAEMGGAPPDAGMGQPTPVGPAGNAPAPLAPPGAVPAGRGQGTPGNAPAGPPQGAPTDGGETTPAQKFAAAIPKKIIDRLVGAGAGAALGAGEQVGLGRKRQLLSDKVQQMQSEAKGGFGHAAALAAAKGGLANAELAEKHPIGSAITGGLGGAFLGAQLGPGLKVQGQKLIKSVKGITGIGE